MYRNKEPRRTEVEAEQVEWYSLLVQAYFSVELRAYAQSVGKVNFLVAGEVLGSTTEIREYIANMSGTSVLTSSSRHSPHDDARRPRSSRYLEERESRGERKRRKKER